MPGPSRRRPAVVGVRPDAIRPARSGDAPSSVVQVLVEAIERYGDRIDLVMRRAGVRLVSRCGDAACSASEGDRVAICIDLSRAHLFERGERGRLIT
ncbi:MAG: TOBE domain-containing protein [Phycisphaerales bacterium]